MSGKSVIDEFVIFVKKIKQNASDKTNVLINIQ